MRRSLGLAAFVFLSIQIHLHAAVVTVQPKLGAVLNSDFTPVDPALIMSADDDDVYLAPRAEKYVLQIDFLMTISELNPPTQLGFGNAAFNIHANGLTQSAELPGWNLDVWTVDHNGPNVPGAKVGKWAGAGDADVDLQYIVLETVPRGFYMGDNTSDPRRSLGVAPYDNADVDAFGRPVTPHDDGEFAGWVLFEIDASAGNAGDVSAVVIGASTYSFPDLNLSTAGNRGAASDRLRFQIVPEPTTLVLSVLSIASFAFLLAQRYSTRNFEGVSHQLGGTKMRRLLALAAFAVLSIPIDLQAAVVKVQPKLAAVLNSDFSHVDPGLIISADEHSALLAPRAEKYVLQIDFLMTISDLNPPTQQGFGNAAMNIHWNGLDLNEDIALWNRDTWTVDHNGPLPGSKVDKWIGVEESVWPNILLDTNPKGFFMGDETTDPRRTLGVAPYDNANVDPFGRPVTPYDDGELAGWVFFEIDASAGSAGDVSAIVTGSSTYDLPGYNLSTAGNGGAASDMLRFQVVPEPTSLSILVLGCASIAVARRRSYRRVA